MEEFMWAFVVLQREWGEEKNENIYICVWWGLKSYKIIKEKFVIILAGVRFYCKVEFSSGAFATGDDFLFLYM